MGDVYISEYAAMCTSVICKSRQRWLAQRIPFKTTLMMPASIHSVQQGFSPMQGVSAKLMIQVFLQHQ